MRAPRARTRARSGPNATHRPADAKTPTRPDEEARMPPFQTLRYDSEPPLATITLNRPERLNTIVPPMPDELDAAVEQATRDEEVKVMILRGAGRSFCAGFDFGGGFHHWDEHLT